MVLGRGFLFPTELLFMHPENADPWTSDIHFDGQNCSKHHRWCEKYGYFIDLGACEARAGQKSFCRRCMAKWRQLSFSFMDIK
jgi:hypothetical protein